MFVSIHQDRTLAYPEADEFFSPSEHFPEYPFQHFAGRPNRIYSAVRETLLQSGLDAANAGTPRWNPLGTYVRPGARVFLLCNFVYHQKPNESREAFHSKCTHASVIRAIADYVHIAAGPQGRISFGNAPLQSCEWERVLADSGATTLLEFYRSAGVAIEARDLRLFVAPRNLLGQITTSAARDDSKAAIVSLGARSALNELYQADDAALRVDGKEVEFRVSDYNPDRTESFHQRGRHDYVIHREILESDVVISVPKLKTHEKVGITVALKGMVGCVGHKDCLAHHRFGPPTMRGDEYPDSGPVRVMLSRYHDFVYRRRYPAFLRPALEIVDKNSRRIMRRVFRKIQAGAWHGNDTAWRMTLDLARIMHFADREGRMTDTIQRKHLVLVDGVIGGEGNGPLSPAPVDSGALIFGDGVVAADMAASRLMGYEPDRIAMLRHAAADRALSGEPPRVAFNGAPLPMDDLQPALGRPFAPPVGWRGFV